VTFSVTKWREAVPSRAVVVFCRYLTPPAECSDHCREHGGGEPPEVHDGIRGNHSKAVGKLELLAGTGQGRQISSGLGEQAAIEASRRGLSNCSRPLLSHCVSPYHSLVPLKNRAARFWITGWARDCWAGLQQGLQLPCRPCARIPHTDVAACEAELQYRKA